MPPPVLDRQVCIEIIGGNCTAQNMLIADMYEKEHDKSMATALERSPKEKLVFALQAPAARRKCPSWRRHKPSLL